VAIYGACLTNLGYCVRHSSNAPGATPSTGSSRRRPPMLRAHTPGWDGVAVLTLVSPPPALAMLCDNGFQRCPC
jgi:hypothetical protein